MSSSMNPESARPLLGSPIALALPPRRSAVRGAFTILEVVIGMAILALLLAMVYAFQSGATRSTAITGEHSVALRSVMVAMESLRRDVEQMLYQCPKLDLALLPHAELGANRGLSLRVPDGLAATDPWKATYVPVQYSLRRVPGAAHAYHLIRTEVKTGQETALRSCLLRDMLIHYVPLKAATSPGLSSFQAYLEITLVGLGSATGTTTYTASMMAPLALMYPAGPYTVQVPSGGR